MSSNQQAQLTNAKLAEYTKELLCRFTLMGLNPSMKTDCYGWKVWINIKEKPLPVAGTSLGVCTFRLDSGMEQLKVTVADFSGSPKTRFKHGRLESLHFDINPSKVLYTWYGYHIEQRSPSSFIGIRKIKVYNSEPRTVHVDWSQQGAIQLGSGQSGDAVNDITKQNTYITFLNTVEEIDRKYKDTAKQIYDMLENIRSRI